LNISPHALNHYRKCINWEEIDNKATQNLLKICLTEDLGEQRDENLLASDATTKICQITANGKASIVSREALVLCGIGFVPQILEVFNSSQLKFNFSKKDGDLVERGETIGVLEGCVDKILLIERTILNLLQKLSGVATCTNDFCKKINPYGVGLLDTRKTTPGMRLFEKYATGCGGGFNHRMGLHDQIMIKDNHLAAASAKDGVHLRNFLTNIINRNKEKKIIQVEVDNLKQLDISLEVGVDAILLDNFSPSEIAKAVKICKNHVVLEASGGINFANLEDYAKAGPHFISTGAPIHSSRWVDIALDWS
tara:strand:+ start:109 stop:1035 length:927 start_codon:yes stop_codon:yes gene_type:complete